MEQGTHFFYHGLRGYFLDKRMGVILEPACNLLECIGFSTVPTAPTGVWPFFTMSTWLPSTVPTAPNSLAQGNAPGDNVREDIALNGRNKRTVLRNILLLSSPFRAVLRFLFIPRALPWANESGAVGTAKKRHHYSVFSSAVFIEIANRLLSFLRERCADSHPFIRKNPRNPWLRGTV
jgi:hypothetical protein